MDIDFQKLRLDGVYQMKSAGDLMLRVKLAAGVVSAEQALIVCDVAEAYAGGRLHLTTRGSIELHRLRYEQLPEIARRFARVGLTSRGACGGAVRGVSCSTSSSVGFARAQVLARRLQRHFTGNPHFEGLPKKFKIAVEGSAVGGRHLIQDAGLVLASSSPDGDRYDLWIAGGLGREPRPAFLYATALPEGEVVPLLEAIVRAYRKHVPAPKRLKSLAALHGEAGLRRLIEAEQGGFPATAVPPVVGEGRLTAIPSGEGWIEIPVFGGEVASSTLRSLAEVARDSGDGFLVVTADQNLALIAADASQAQELRASIAAALPPALPESDVTFRICPGSHACRMGLAPTRDAAREIIARLSPEERSASWAISGCPNSCSQPQLADVGIVATRLVAADHGQKEPCYTLLRRRGDGFGEAAAQDLSLQQLLNEIARLNS